MHQQNTNCVAFSNNVALFSVMISQIYDDHDEQECNYSEYFNNTYDIVNEND